MDESPGQSEEGFLLYAPQSMLQRDATTRALFAAEVRSADVCVDVGAHVGYFTCIACAAGTATVAVEPLKDQSGSSLPQHRIEQVHQCGSVPGWSRRQTRLAPIYGYSDIASLILAWNAGSPTRTDTISVSTLDLLLGNRFRGQKLLIKIDVEGFELDVLAGAAENVGA